MNDDDFDDMVIDNQTTMHVNKTPVSSAASKTRTDLSHKSSMVDNEGNRDNRNRDNRNRDMSDIVNRGIERIIGEGGDNSRTTGDVRRLRAESPVPGTSKDDMESPIIPVVQPGTKVGFPKGYNVGWIWWSVFVFLKLFFFVFAICDLMHDMEAINGQC